jgi:cytochrome c oxidase cbb3-type subunit II
MSRFRSERGAAGPGAIAGGTILCLLVAFVVTVLLPITDTANRDDAKGKPRTYDQVALNGRSLYIREGCFECHSQQVRNTFADSGLGPAPSEAGLYSNEAPNLMGIVRFGPDLTCFGDRAGDAGSIVGHLRNPEAVHHDSTMPHYSYLTTKELRALAAYLLRLQCKEG